MGSKYKKKVWNERKLSTRKKGETEHKIKIEKKITAWQKEKKVRTNKQKRRLLCVTCNTSIDTGRCIEVGSHRFRPNYNGTFRNQRHSSPLVSFRRRAICRFNGSNRVESEVMGTQRFQRTLMISSNSYNKSSYYCVKVRGKLTKTTYFDNDNNSR